MYFCIECKQLLYIYICVYPVPYVGLIALKCQLQRTSTSTSFPLSLWLNAIALPKVIKSVFYDCLCN